MMNHFKSWLKEFFKVSKDENFRDFISNYLSLFTRFIGIIICVLQTAWFLKDLTILKIDNSFANSTFLLRNSSWIIFPFIMTKKIPERFKWIPCLVLVWLSVFSTLILDLSGAVKAGLTGDGWVTYYLLFFLISIITNKQSLVYLSYVLFTILVLRTSTDFGGHIEYMIPIFRIMTTGMILCIGMICISIMIRSSFIQLFIRECELKDALKRDTLTGIFNRAKLNDLIDENERLHRPGNIFILDIDKFKTINDTWGHIAGDDAIRFAAAALKKSIRKSDILIRYGGDEFLIVTDGFINEEQLWNKILENLKSPDNIYHITFSAGSCKCEREPLFGTIKKADGAAYNSKFNGRNQLTVFEKLI